MKAWKRISIWLQIVSRNISYTDDRGARMRLTLERIMREGEGQRWTSPWKRATFAWMCNEYRCVWIDKGYERKTGGGHGIGDSAWRFDKSWQHSKPREQINEQEQRTQISKRKLTEKPRQHWRGEYLIFARINKAREKKRLNINGTTTC